MQRSHFGPFFKMHILLNQQRNVSVKLQFMQQVFLIIQQNIQAAFAATSGRQAGFVMVSSFAQSLECRTMNY